MSYSIANQSPSTGYIAWSNVNISFDGSNYAITNGNTNLKYVYWLKSSPTVLQKSNTYPTLSSEDCIVFINNGGVATSVLDSAVTDGGLIVPGTVTADAIAARTITASKIAVGAITANEIASNTITASKIAAGTITASQIASETITGSQIAAGTIGATEIASGAITTAKVAAGAITANEIATYAITSANIASGAITANKLAIGSALFDRVKLFGSSANMVGSAAGSLSINGAVVKSSSSRGHTVFVYNKSTHAFVSQTSYDTYAGATACDAMASALNAITSSSVVFITSYDAVAFDSTSNALRLALKRCGASNAIDSMTGAARYGYVLIGVPGIGEGNGIELAKSAATSEIPCEVSTFWIDSEIQGVGSSLGSLTKLSSTYIADGAITTAKITAGAITSNEIAANAITAAKIAAGTITSTEIAAGTISTANIKAGAITATEIASSTITGAQIAANTITAAKIAAGTITANEIATGTITAAKIASGTITGSNIAAGTLSADKLTIGNFTNLVANPSFELITAEWSSLASGVSIVADSTNASSGSYVMKRVSTANDIVVSARNGNMFECRAGDKFYLKGLIKSTSGATGTAEWRISWRDKNKAEVGTSVLSWTPGTSYVIKDAIFTAPTSTSFAVIETVSRNQTAGTWYWGEVYCSPATVSTSIVDGAITTAKVAASAITGNEIAANAITAAKIAAGTITGTQIAAGTITGDKILANTITAKNMVVGDYSNVALDPNGDNGDPLFAGCSIISVTEGKAYQCPSATRDSLSDQYFTVDVGDQYYVQADMNWISGGTARSQIGLCIFDSSGGTIGWYAGASCSDTSPGWKTVGGSITIPIGAVKAKLWWQREGTNGDANSCGVWKMRMITVRRKANGNLIVDGAITAAKIATGTITATQIAAGTITGDKLVASTITGSKIAADTITASNILAGTITATEIATGAITGSKIAASQTISAPNISGGTLNLGSGNFVVDSGGNVTSKGAFTIAKNGTGVGGVKLTQDRLDVYDESGVLRVRVGLL